MSKKTMAICVLTGLIGGAIVVVIGRLLDMAG